MTVFFILVLFTAVFFFIWGGPIYGSVLLLSLAFAVIDLYLLKPRPPSNRNHCAD